MDLLRELGGDARPPDPGRPGDQHELAAATRGALPAREQPVQLGGAAEDRGPRGGRELVGQLGGLRRQPRILPEDRLLQVAQLRARLDAELADEPLARVLVGVERLGLAAAAVEREHQLGGEALVRRVLGHQPAQLADDLGVPAGGDVGLDAARERGDPRLLEAAHLAGCERLVRQVAERRAAPQAERLAQQLRRGVGPAGRQLAPAARDELVEALHVALAGADAEPVPGRGPRHRVAVAERLAQPRDVDLHGLDRPGRRVRAPQRERQPLGADRLVRIQEKDGEDRSRLGSTERDRAVGAADLQRSQDVELHRPRRNATFRRVAWIGRSRFTHRRAGRAERPGTTGPTGRSDTGPVMQRTTTCSIAPRRSKTTKRSMTSAGQPHAGQDVSSSSIRGESAGVPPRYVGWAT